MADILHSAESIEKISTYLMSWNALVLVAGDDHSGNTMYDFAARILGYKGSWRACVPAQSQPGIHGMPLPSELAASFFASSSSSSASSSAADTHAHPSAAWPAALEDAPTVSFRTLCGHEDPAARVVPLYTARGEPSQAAVQAFGRAGTPGAVVWLGYDWQGGEQKAWGELLQTLIQGFAGGAYSAPAASVLETAGAAGSARLQQQSEGLAVARRRLQDESADTSPPPPESSPPPPADTTSPPLPEEASPPPLESSSPSPPSGASPPPLSLISSLCPLPLNRSSVFVLGPAGMKPWGTKSIGPKLFPDRSASFIWSYANASLGTAPPTPPNPTFVKTVTVPAATTAYLHVIVDANAEVLLNGVRVAGVWCGWGGSTGLDAYAGRPIPLQLQAGTNTIGLRASSTKGSSGLLASLYAADNVTVLARTDATWEYYNTPVASVLGAAGSAPWGKANVNRLAFDDTKAQWIWAASTDPSGLSPTFIYPYHVNKAKDALLHIMAANQADIYLNGALVGSVTDGWRAGEYTGRPIRVNLIAGTNFFAIKVTNTDGGSGGLLASLQGGDGIAVFMRTGADWSYVYEGCTDSS